jgi:hypothetical protein
MLLVYSASVAVIVRMPYVGTIREPDFLCTFLLYTHILSPLSSSKY